MASPVLQTQTEGFVSPTAGTTHTVTFPSGAVSGDLILIFMAFAAPQATVTAGDSFTKVQINPASGNGNFFAFYKQIDGTEGGNMAVTTGGSTKSAWTVHRITGHAAPGTQAPEFGTLATGTGATPDPPAAVMTGGSKDYLVFATFRQNGEVLDDDAQVNTGPGSYTFTAATVGHQKSTGTGGAASSNCLVSTAYRALTAASENPGTFGVDSTTLAWQAQTVTIHPAAALVDADAEISWTELQVPSLNADAEVAWAELEVPTASADAEVAWAEFEVPLAPAGGEVAWAEVEVPLPDADAEISWAELEVPTASADAEVSWTEFEVPTANAGAEIAWTELEVPALVVDANAEVSWAEFELPSLDAGAEISWTELEVPSLDADAEISWAELEVPTADSAAEISWAELEIPTADSAAEVSWSEFEVPALGPADSAAELAFVELEVPSVDASAEISWAEVEIPDLASLEDYLNWWVAHVSGCKNRSHRHYPRPESVPDGWSE